MLKRFFQEGKPADAAQGNVNFAQTLRIWARFGDRIKIQKDFFSNKVETQQKQG